MKHRIERILAAVVRSGGYTHLMPYGPRIDASR